MSHVSIVSADRPKGVAGRLTTGEHQNVDTAQRYELKLSFHELSPIHKSLLAAKSLGVLSQEDKLIDNTIQLVGQALAAAA